MPLLKINDAEFAGAIKENPVILVDFYADWCGPCKMIGPILEELANEGHVIAKIDVDANQQVAQSYAISSIPTLLVFKEGELVKTHMGFAAKAQIEEMLK